MSGSASAPKRSLTPPQVDVETYTENRIIYQTELPQDDMWFDLYQGCYVDTDPRVMITPEGIYVRDSHWENNVVYDMPVDKASRVYCNSLCAIQGYSYFGLQHWRHCFCDHGMDDSYVKQNRDICNQKCTGEDAEVACGGEMSNSVYMVDPQRADLALIEEELDTVSNGVDLGSFPPASGNGVADPLDNVGDATLDADPLDNSDNAVVDADPLDNSDNAVVDADLVDNSDRAVVDADLIVDDTVDDAAVSVEESSNSNSVVWSNSNGLEIEELFTAPSFDLTGIVASIAGSIAIEDKGSDWALASKSSVESSLQGILLADSSPCGLTDSRVVLHRVAQAVRLETGTSTILVDYSVLFAGDSANSLTTRNCMRWVQGQVAQLTDSTSPVADQFRGQIDSTENVFFNQPEERTPAPLLGAGANGADLSTADDGTLALLILGPIVLVTALLYRWARRDGRGRKQEEDVVPLTAIHGNQLALADTALAATKPLALEAAVPPSRSKPPLRKSSRSKPSVVKSKRRAAAGVNHRSKPRLALEAAKSGRSQSSHREV